MTRIFPVLMVSLFLAVSPPGAVAEPYWVFFTGRGSVDVTRSVAAKAVSAAEPKALSRRAKLLGSDVFDERDLPVNPEYIAAVAGIAGPVRTVTRYFNGVSVEADSARLDALRALPFVRSVRPVARFRRSEPDTAGMLPAAEKAASASYGASYSQMSRVGVIGLHDAGYWGDGILIGVLDSGFDNLGHAAFDSLTIANQWDFVGGDADVGGHDHGTEVLSILAANDPGNMIGAAPHAEYLLARTEIINSDDVHAEEDYFVAGVEWMDSLGADVIQTSLGYTTFSDGASYTYADLDGETAVTTVAAEIAAEKGIVFVCSAGNEGDDDWYYVCTPADGERVIAVGSVNSAGTVSSFSSRGPTYDGRVKPDFVALGEGVRMVGTTGDTYTTGSGTSYAAPAVSGAAALLLQAHPEWTAAVLYDSLRATAEVAAADSLAGYGFIDAFAASGLEAAADTVTAFRVYPPYPQPAVFGSSNLYLYFPLAVPDAGKEYVIDIYTFSGTRVRSLTGTLATAGSYLDRSTDGTGAPNWDGTSFAGEDVAPGIYFYTIKIAGYPGHKGKIAVMR